MKSPRKNENFLEKRKETITHNEGETLQLAEALASGLRGDEVICLAGELGAGKTVFAKGLAAGLGLEDVDQVCSPSFTLVNLYQARCRIYHVDLYRLSDETEIAELGLEDYLGEGIVIIEWAEKTLEIPCSIWVEIAIIDGDERSIKISRNG